LVDDRVEKRSVERDRGRLRQAGLADDDRGGGGGLGSGLVDRDEPGFGFWKFQLGSGGYSAAYSDVGSSNNGFVFMFAGPDATHDGCTTVTP
jgi:hypothetical protein